MLCAKVPSRRVATNDYHGGGNCAQNGHVENVVEKVQVQEMGFGSSTISVAHTRAKVAASCDVPEK